MSADAEIKILANKLPGDIRNIDREPKGIAVEQTWRRGSIFFPLQILNNILKSKPDIIHLQYGWLLYGGAAESTIFLPILLLLRLTQKPIIVTMHTVVLRSFVKYRFNVANQIANLAILGITKMLALASSCIIVLNDLAKEVLVKEFGIMEDKVVVIPHGSKEANASSKSERKANPLILSLGFLREGKDLDCLITSFKDVSVTYPNAELLIVGGKHAHDSGSFDTKLKELASQSRQITNIMFWDYASEYELDKFASASDVVVLLSSEHFYVESSGALARIANFEKPVICSRVPKFQSELEDGLNCIMVKPQDPESLANALRALIENEDLRNKIAANLKTRFGANHWDIIAKRHLKLYEAELSVHRGDH